MLSVIICTYNRDKYIFNLLQSVAQNTLSVEDYEIILINNNSIDKTEEECKRFQAAFPKVKFYYFIEKNQGLSYARNRGIKESKGDIFVYVDDDALVNDTYLETYYQFFIENLSVAAAGGAIIPEYETESPTWMSHFTKNLITGYLYFGDQQKAFKKDKYPGGGNAAYRKEVFEKVGGFNVELGRKGDALVGAEEKDIFDKMKQLGMSFYYLPNAVLFHLIPASKLTKDYFKRLTYSIGKSEYLRTTAISKTKYLKRLFMEGVKWAASLVLFLFYFLQLSPQKGVKLLAFRWNVSKGLLGL